METEFTKKDSNPTVSMIGLGKLGLPCAEVMATQCNVFGYDVAPVRSEAIKIKNSIKEAVQGAQYIFVAVPTPHDPMYDGRGPIAHLPKKDFDYTTVKEVLSEIKAHANSSQKVVLISTVLPGTIRREFLNLMGEAQFIYNPYFIAMGTVAEDFLNPEFHIIGTENGDMEEAQDLIDFYKKFTPRAEFNVGTWTEAECVKIFYNTFISFKLSFVNMIQDVSMRLGDINVDVVTKALCDGGKRILSPMYMKAGMGDGGPCHPRDNIALRWLADKTDLGYDLFDAVMSSREIQAKNLAQYLASFGMDVCILGKAFKPGVALLDGSYSVLVAHYIGERGVKVVFWDPKTGDAGPTEDKPHVYLLGHIGEEYHEFGFKPGSIVVDPWRGCPQIEGCQVIHYGDTRVKDAAPDLRTSYSKDQVFQQHV